VTGITVEIPSQRLREGVVLVDTPGIGSLATSGSAETFAYLPRCDLSVVLIDAGSTLNQEDLHLLRDLYEAGIPAQVLLSKTDLLTEEDRQRVLQYIREQLRQELGLDMAVHPVSVVGKDAALLEIILQDAAKAVVESARNASGKDHKPVAQVIQESLVQVGQTAREFVTGLRKTLCRVLEALEKVVPLVKADTADLVRDLRELERAGSAAGGTAAGEEASHRPSTDGEEASKRHNRGTTATASNPQ
jgi:Fe2+ transport system protein B